MNKINPHNNSYKVAITLLFLFFFAANSFAQKKEKVLVSLNLKENSYQEIIAKISEQTGFNFVYSSSFLPPNKRSFSVEKLAINKVLELLFSETNLTYKIKKKEIILVVSNRKKTTKTISGMVRNEANGEVLIGITVQLEGKAIGTISNNYGFYSISLPKGKYRLKYSAIGFVNKLQVIDLQKDTIINLNMISEVTELDEIEITAKKESDLNKTQMSNFVLTSELLNNTPAFFGENDLVRVLQMLPGVQAGSGVNTGLFVRGGNADQNLILVDETPIYNASHLFGFFSVFNPDATKEVELYKGGIPAKYGGRISSVIDVKTKDGNTKEQHITGGIGSLSSKLTFEKPLKNGKGSFIFSGRRTYLDFLLKAVPVRNISANQLFFYDINSKFNWKPNQKNAFSIATYLGNDKTGFEKVLGTVWGNKLGSIRWTHIYNPRLFSNVTAYVTSFRSKSTVQLSENLAYATKYSLIDFGLKSDFSYFINPKASFDFGFSVIRHRYLFGEITPLDQKSIVEEQRSKPTNALETAAYINLEQEVTDNLSVNLGLRFSTFSNIGAADVFIYDTENVVAPQTSKANIIDTVNYKFGEFYNTYAGFEPRITFRYSFGDNNAIKVSYNRTRQYLHQLSNSNTPSPQDMWTPVNQYIKPQIADQVALGYFLNFKKSKMETSIEFYYKKLQNQLDFKPLADLFLNQHIETDVLLGTGRAYGMEMLLKKKEGKSTGWLTYTLSRSERQIDGINNNSVYPTSFDRMHNISVVFAHQLSKRITLSFDWVYASGVAYSFPVGKYEKDGFLVPYYTGRNNFRLPPTHHLDFSITFFRKANANKKNESNFNFSVYNMYLRKNTIGYVFRQKQDDRTQTEAVKLYFPVFIPSFSYNFKF